MSKKSKAPTAKVSVEDALRLRVALLELEQVRANAAKAIDEAAATAEKLRSEMWARHGLAPEDSVDLRTGAISRGA